MNAIRRFFVPDHPAGYVPGELARLIAERDLPLVECSGDGTPSSLRCKAGEILLRERVKRNFLQYTAIPVFTMGVAEGNLKAAVRHEGFANRTGLEVTGDEELAAPLRRPEVAEILMPLDFTRLELSGSPTGIHIEIETFGAAQVIMRIPRVRRYVSLGKIQSQLLVRAFEAIAGSFSAASMKSSPVN